MSSLIDVRSADPGEDLFRRGLSDGLPVEIPTPDRVAAYVAAAGLDAGEVIAHVPPAFSPATVERVAANAIMAGCPAEVMPVVLAAVRAICRPEFNLFGVRTSNHPATPLLVIGGPIVERAGFNAGTNLFGPASRANATTGRALNLVIQNIGGATLQLIDQSTMGHPGRYTFCIAEDPQSPWAPLHCAVGGLAPESSAVTVFAGDAPIAVADYASLEPEELIDTFAYHVAYVWQNPFHVMSEVLLVINPAHARVLTKAGEDRVEVLRRITASARSRTGPLALDGIGHDYESGVHLMCAGGPWGQYSALVNGWVGPREGSTMVTEEVQS
ncbi:MAG TPA: hypothetical protein VG294_19635 [Solirubrobacteraceae bacterium]|nr:hypothetical protein [Solirubrobacteraceae bacterium]